MNYKMINLMKYKKNEKYFLGLDFGNLGFIKVTGKILMVFQLFAKGESFENLRKIDFLA